MRILVGVDGSDLSLDALDRAIRRGQETGDHVAVAVFSTDERSLAAVEAEVRDLLETLDADPPVEQIETEPGSKLVEIGERDDHDRIVLAGGTRSPLGKIQLDDVVEFVILNAQISVTLVR